MTDNDKTTIIHCCQGPPSCNLEGLEAIEAQLAGCPFCKRIIVFEDGTTHEHDPARTKQ